jgi:hypothetical protein
MSTCVKCGGTVFVAHEKSIRNYQYKVNLVECEACGGVAGVLPCYDPGALGLANEKRILAVGETINTVFRELNQQLGEITALLQRKSK